MNERERGETKKDKTDLGRGAFFESFSFDSDLEAATRLVNPSEK
jgi:hypothetical protein